MPVSLEGYVGRAIQAAHLEAEASLTVSLAREQQSFRVFIMKPHPNSSTGGVEDFHSGTLSYSRPNNTLPDAEILKRGQQFIIAGL
jgi:hypothetical protein